MTETLPVNTTRILILALDRPGVLARIITIVTAQGENIDRAEAFPVGGTGLANVHIWIRFSPGATDRVVRKLSKLVDVVELVAGHADSSLHLSAVWQPFGQGSIREEYKPVLD